MSISLICACKNRELPLRISLTSWLMFKEITEIIIVDWSSDQPLNYLTELDTRIKVVRVDEEQYFNQPEPLNLAAKISTGEYILKVDIDYVLNPYYNFFEQNTIDGNSFICGENDCDRYKEQYYKFLWGLLYISKKNFLKVGGYNENMDSYYSFDDEELNIRLEYSGLQKKKINCLSNTIFHIPHPDKKRFENFKFSNVLVDKLDDRFADNKSILYDILSYSYDQNQKLFYPDKNNFVVDSKNNWVINEISPQIFKAKR